MSLLEPNPRRLCPQLPAPVQHSGHPPAGARCVVQLLLGHPLVAAAREDLRLVLCAVPPPDHLKPDQVRWEPAPEATGPLL